MPEDKLSVILKQIQKGRHPRKQAAGRFSLQIKKSHALFLLALAVLLSISCAKTTGEAKKKTDAAPPAATRDRSQVESGQVRFSAVVEPPAPAISDEARLTLTIDYADGVEVDFPPFGKTVGGFAIRDIRRPPAKTAEGRRVIQEVLTLEPSDVGRMTIYPINVTYTDKRPDGDGKQHSLRSEELSVNVTSLVASGEASLDNLRPVAAPLGLPYPPRYALWAGIAAALLIAAVAAYVRHRRKAAREAVKRIPTPAELAYEALRRLRDSHLAERDAKLYYVELTGIVRLFIERTKGIRAPEQTTEEFLREIARREAFPREEGVRLRNFLQAADLVKFAAHKPRSEDIEDSFRRAEEFVGYGEDV